MTNAISRTFRLSKSKEQIIQIFTHAVSVEIKVKLQINLLHISSDFQASGVIRCNFLWEAMGTTDITTQVYKKAQIEYFLP